MAIKGSLKEASLPDVLQLLSMGKKSGCLSVTHRQSFGCTARTFDPAIVILEHLRDVPALDLDQCGGRRPIAIPLLRRPTDFGNLQHG